jgi:signal transduction histidine kinase
MRNSLLLALFLAILIPHKIMAQYEIMVSDSYPPYNYVNENGKLTGFNVEILEAIIELSQAEIELKSGSWDTINSALENGYIHAIAGTHYAEAPDARYIYTRTTINTSHCFIFNTDKFKYFSLEHLRMEREPIIALYKNDVLMYYIWSINPTAKFLFFDNYKDLVHSINNENVYCAFTKRVGGMYYAQKHGVTNIGASEHRVLERNMGFKVAKDHPELAEIINNGLEVILANGTYERIYHKWIPEYDQTYVKWQKYVRYAFIFGIIAIVITLSLIIFNRVLKNRVTVKTNDLQTQLDLNSKMLTELEKQKNIAEESDKMKSAFLANMSHEIRTPMNGIIGFAELLKTEDLSEEEKSHFLDVILRSGNRMLGTINNIIEVSKLESGVEKLLVQKVDVANIVNELNSFFSAEAESKGLKFIVEEDLSETEFFTDEYKLNSVLTNLIKNAIKFTKEGFVKVEIKLDETKLNLVVEDSGIGIPQEKQNSIFEQFVQADFSHSNGFEGSGLGLSITNGYIQLLKGKIKLSSVEGSGSRFDVEIPNLKS